MFGLANSSANEVFSLEVPGQRGVLGMAPCPGVRVETLRRSNAQRNARRDIAGLQAWGATGVVSLVEQQELDGIGVPDLGAMIQEAGFWWRHLAVVDMNVPDALFESQWKVEGPRICQALEVGERIVIHCYAGLGRTGLLAARLLVETGTEPELAIALVRKVRPRAIQTRAQEDYVRALGPQRSARAPARSRDDRWSRLRKGGVDGNNGA